MKKLYYDLTDIGMCITHCPYFYGLENHVCVGSVVCKSNSCGCFCGDGSDMVTVGKGLQQKLFVMCSK